MHSEWTVQITVSPKKLLSETRVTLLVAYSNKIHMHDTLVQKTQWCVMSVPLLHGQKQSESGEKSEREHEQNSCQQFSTLMQNIQVTNRELALVHAENLSKQFYFICLGGENFDMSIKNLPVDDRTLITSSIFSLENENVKGDIASCS